MRRAINLDFFRRYGDEGLLFVRVGIGAMFVCHGAPKLVAGPDGWEEIGRAMSYVGVDWLPAFWGFVAGCVEFGGGLVLMLGLFFRPACGLLACAMLVAATMHLRRGDGFQMASHAIESGILFLGLIFIGPGKYSVHKVINSDLPPESPPVTRHL